MPDVDGFELTRWIREDRALREMPVVMLTSIGRAGEGRRDVQAYLTKPVKQSDLLDALATIFDREAAAAVAIDGRPGRRPERPAPRPRRSESSSPRTTR